MARLSGIVCGLAGLATLIAQTPPASNQASTQQSAVTAQMREIWPNLPPNQDPAQVARGKALFETNCSFCHGPEATGGNGGPDLVRSVLVNHDEHGNLIGPTIRNGRPGKGMPAFATLSHAQIDELIAYLHQRNRDARIRFSYRLENVNTGDPVAGKLYFDEHCAHCHSAQGDLAGIATKYDPAQLQQLWLDPAQNRATERSAQHESVTVIFPSGQKLSGTLEHVDEFDVSLYDANGYHSFTITPGMQITVDNPMQPHEDLLTHLTDADIHNVTSYLGTLK